MPLADKPPRRMRHAATAIGRYDPGKLTVGTEEECLAHVTIRPGQTESCSEGSAVGKHHPRHRQNVYII